MVYPLALYAWFWPSLARMLSSQSGAAPRDTAGAEAGASANFNNFVLYAVNEVFS